MSIIIRNMAKVVLPEEHRLPILKMYSYQGYGDKDLITYSYDSKSGTALLPLNMDKLRVVAGLLGEELVNERSKGAPLKEPFTLQPGFSFRDYQQGPAQQLVEYLKKHQYGTFGASCGTGKTIMCAYAGGMSQMKNLILLDQGNLIENWETAYKMIWGKDLQQLTNSTTEFADVSVTTFQLLHRNPQLLQRIRSEYGHCNIDEAHTVKADTFKQVMFRLDNYQRLATSATFYDKYLPTEVLIDICGGPVAVTMVDEKALKCYVRFINTQVTVPDNTTDGFVRNSLPYLATNDARNGILIEIIRRCTLLKRKMIVVAITQAQAEYLTTKCREFCRIESYTGTSTQKYDRSLKERFEGGELDGVVSCLKFRKGTDFPSADTLIMARPYNNQAMTEQFRGRIVRAQEGKPEPWVFDLVDRGQKPWMWAGTRHQWHIDMGDRFDQPHYFFLDRP